MGVSADLRFARSHEWVRVDGDRVRVGISDYAQDAVGDVVFVDLPRVGAEVAAGDAVAEVESTKTVSAIMAPLSGRVVAVNDALDAAPEAVNDDPYGAGWMFALAPTDPIEASGSSEWDALMDDAAYGAYVAGLSG